MKKLNDPFAPTPEGFHLRVEQTLNGLEEREMTRRKFTASLAVALVLVMFMAAAAVAAVTGGYVGWDGIIHYYEDDDATVEPVDESAFAERRAADETYNKYLQTIPRGECWIITKDGEEITGLNFPNMITDEEAFLALIEGTDLPVPSIPDGYQMIGATIITDCEETPYAERTLDDGAVLSKYKLKAPVAGEIDNYDYQFWMDYGNAHAIYARIVPASEHLTDDVVMHVSDYHTAEAVKVEDFEYGLYVHDSEFGAAECILMKDMGDKMLRVDIVAFEDLPKEAVLNLFNPEGNIDLTNHETESVRFDYGAFMRDVPEGEYWEIDCADIEGHIVSKPNDPTVEDFDALAKLTKLPVPTLPEGFTINSIHAMPAIETDLYEEIVMENGDVLRKYRLAEVIEGKLEQYRFIVENGDGFLISYEVFTESAAQNRKVELPDFTNAEVLTVPGFDSALYLAKEFSNDTAHLLLTAGDTSIYVIAWDEITLEDILALFPAE